MMSRKWVLLACLGLLTLSLFASAGVTDPNIIASVTRNNSTMPAPVVVPGGLVQGAQIFSDRLAIFWGEPGTFYGIDYIQTAMDDKADADVQYQVALKGPGTLFLIVDNRVGDGVATDPPALGTKMAWVNDLGFTQTGYTIGFNEPATVYSKVFAPGDPNTILLGEQNDGTGRAMYSIAAVPQGWNMYPVITGVPATAQVEPGGTLAINATVTDDGIPGTGLTYQWTTQTAPEGATAVFSPNDTSEDVTVSFSHLGAYTLKLAVSDGEQVSEKVIQVMVQTPTFAVTGFQQLTACNDNNTGPTSHYATTVMHIRNYISADATQTRRRVAFQKYNISALKRAGKMFANSYLTWNFSKRSSGQSVYVYAITEAQDDFDLSASNSAWINVPGIKNDWPRGAEITLDTLDQPDISPLLLSYAPAATGTWYSTPTSAALDEVLNADIDGYIMLMFICHDPQNNSSDFEPYSITGSPVDPDSNLKGVIIKGQIRDTVWASQPSPAINTTVKISLPQLSWANPKPSEEGAAVTSDVYLGTTEPNLQSPTYGLTTLATGITDEFVALAPGTLQRNQTYYWVVDTHDSARPEVARGFVWNFNTNNAAPTVNTGAAQYVWLNNAGDPATATVSINATVEDDGYPAPYTLLWEMLSGPEGAAVVIDPNNVEDITLVLPKAGAYVFKLSANDTDLSSSASLQVFVGATPCDAAKAKPGYVRMTADLDNNCYVNIADLSAFAEQWLGCHSFMDAPCI
jgi:hypothetical protein